MQESERQFLDRSRVGHLATANRHGAPHVVPVCYVLSGSTLYVTIDEKPKRRDIPLRRLRNIAENSSVAFLADRYDEDWSKLCWVMLRGRAEILDPGGAEHAEAQDLLRTRYRQLQAMALETLPVIALRVGRTTSWGNLDV